MSSVTVILLVRWSRSPDAQSHVSSLAGSTSEECNLFTGQCACRPGFGGRRCDQCEANFWGDPRVSCKPCNCNPDGVNPDATQCNPTTGQCQCLEGNREWRVQSGECVLYR